MLSKKIKKVCVIGAGNMGHQISLLTAIHGFPVCCVDVDEEQLRKAEQFAENYLKGRVAKGKLSEGVAKQALMNLSFSKEFKIGAQEADFAIEAATEKIELKRAIFKQLDEICPDHSILVTNSSFIVSSLVADVTSRPEKVCNMHFFNPALVMKCVEVVKGPHTSENTISITVEFAKKLNKEPVLLHKEIYGFIVNRILDAINAEALSLYEMGVASFQDIDSAIVNALGHPMGPFRLMDLTGIDLAYHISMERFQETGNPIEKPYPSIVEKYVKQEWGEKTGKGFYEHNE